MKLNILHRICLTAISVTTSLSAFAWGQKGHDVTAYIAEQHLTPTTLAAVTDLLDGMSPVYWANWLDNASHTPEYAYSKTWHYKNIDADKNYWTQPEQQGGDIVKALRMNIATLADSTKSKEDKELAMKMVVHLMGDLHQPMHMGRSTDRGGNNVKVTYFGRNNCRQFPWHLGHQPCGIGPQMGIHRVATATRPSPRGSGSCHNRWQPRRLGTENSQHRPDNLRAHPRIQQTQL